MDTKSRINSADKELTEWGTVAVLILSIVAIIETFLRDFFQNFNLISSQLYSQDVHATNETFRII